jgi:hypothetical protein
MQRNIRVIFAVLGLLVAGFLAFAAFVMVRRASVGAMHGPGFGMMGSGGAAATEPGGLVAVSADGKALPVDPNSKLPEGTAAQTVGKLNVSLALSPYPPVSFSKANFDVTLTDETGQPITDATVSLDLTMPAMPMPSNTPQLKHTANGLYTAEGRFTMRGLWRIEVIIQRGGEKQSAFFDVGL